MPRPPALLDHFVRILLGELDELMVTVDGLLERIPFVGRNVAHYVFSIVPGLVVVVGAVPHSA